MFGFVSRSIMLALCLFFAPKNNWSVIFFFFDALRGCTYSGVLLGDLHVPRAHPVRSYLPKLCILYTCPNLFGPLRIYISTKVCMVAL